MNFTMDGYTLTLLILLLCTPPGWVGIIFLILLALAVGTGVGLALFGLGLGLSTLVLSITRSQPLPPSVSKEQFLTALRALSQHAPSKKTTPTADPTRVRWS